MCLDAAAIQTPALIADFLALAVPVKKAVPVTGITKDFIYYAKARKVN